MCACVVVHLAVCSVAARSPESLLRAWPHRYASGSLQNSADMTPKRRFKIVRWLVGRSLQNSNPLRHVHTILSNDFRPFRVALFEFYDNVWCVAVTPCVTLPVSRVASLDRHTRLVVSSIMALMLLVFWEGQPDAWDTVRSPLLVTQGLLMLVLILDQALYVLVSARHTRVLLMGECLS